MKSNKNLIALKEEFKKQVSLLEQNIKNDLHEDIPVYKNYNISRNEPCKDKDK